MVKKKTKAEIEAEQRKNRNAHLDGVVRSMKIGDFMWLRGERTTGNLARRTRAWARRVGYLFHTSGATYNNMMGMSITRVS